MLILKHEDDATYSQGFSSLVVERVFDILMVAVLGAVALPFVLAVLDVPDWFITVIVVPPSPQEASSSPCFSGRAG